MKNQGYLVILQKKKTIWKTNLKNRLNFFDIFENFFIKFFVFWMILKLVSRDR